MKSLLTSLVALTATLSFADIAVYNGIQVVKTTSLDGTSTIVDKIIQVVDLENSNLVLVTLGFDKATRKRTFSIGETAPILITSVQDSRGAKRSSTVFSQTGSETDATTGITTMTSFLQSGGDLPVTIKGNDKTPLPRNMHGNAWIVSTEGTDADGPVAPAKVEVVSTLILQLAASRASNDAGDTLALAVDRVKADLLAKGYVEVVP
jgi:hypothetical protein